MKRLLSILLFLPLFLNAQLSVKPVHSEKKYWYTLNQVNVVRVSTGEYQNFILDGDGKPYALSNNSALTGTNNTLSAGVPVACVMASGTIEPISQVVGGLHDGLMFGITGKCYHMGANGIDERLAGIGTSADQPYTTEVTTDSLGNSFGNVISAAQFFETSPSGAIGWVTVKSDGSVYVWGRCVDGFMGDGSDGRVITRPFQVALPGGRLGLKVVAGYQIMLLCTNGDVLSWGGGCNTSAHCMGYACSGSSYKSPHVVDNVSGATDIAGGRNWNWAVSATKVWYCGYPKLNGTGSSSDVPIESFTEITSSFTPTLPLKSIVVNTNATLCVDATGKLLGTGNSTEGEIGNGSSLNPADYNYFIPVDALNLVTTWVQIVPTRTDFLKVYGSMSYTYYFITECTDGQWYFSGRNKGGVALNGQVSGDYVAGQIDASYPNSWDQIYAQPVNPFTLIDRILTPSPYCVANPSGSPCNGYSIPTTHNPTVNAGPDQPNVSGTVAELAGSATPFSGRQINSYVWEQISGPNNAHFVYPTLNVSTGSVSGLVTGTYVFRLHAYDNVSNTNTDDVSITVSAVYPNNRVKRGKIRINNH